MELLGIPLFDDDFYKMIVRFLLNFLFLTAVVKYIYYKRSEKKEYLFTFYLIGIVVFFLCFTLKKYELSRFNFRHHSNEGFLPGLRRHSW